MHPPVKRLVATQRAYVQGGRMLLYWSALLLDVAEHHPDQAARNESNERLALITPVVKAFLTEQGFQGASQALQVYGGYGFVCETGVEQYLRDSRITMIYEGTNEIQAVDLLLRKIIGDGNVRLHKFLAQVNQTAEQERSGELARYGRNMLQLSGDIRRLAAAVSAQASERRDLPYWIATEMLRLVGHCAIGWLWLRSARASLDRLNDDPEFHGAQLDTASYYFTYVFAEVKQAVHVVEECLG
jgi:hypothetical protein